MELNKPLSFLKYPASVHSIRKWTAKGLPQEAHSRAGKRGCSAYLSEWKDHVTAAILSAGKADVAVRGEHPPHGVTAAERGPQGAVHHRAQLLLPRQPEESPEELVLGSSLQVPRAGGTGGTDEL